MSSLNRGNLRRFFHFVINLIFIAFLSSLLVHKSLQPVFLGRYSTYVTSLIVSALLIYACYLYGYFKGWKKVAEVYVFVACTLLSVVIIILVLSIVFSTTYSYFVKPPVSLETNLNAIRKSHANLVGLTLDELSILESETWDNAWQYEPWVGFKERPKSGTYVNVDPKGYRKTRGTSENSKYSIFIFGGSTAFGYNVTDDQTIAFYLQDKINRQYGEGLFAVRNYGRGYYYSEQEFILFFQLLKESARPDIVIFFDGLNETGRNVPFYTHEMKLLFERWQDAFRQNSSFFKIIVPYHFFNFIQSIRKYFHHELNNDQSLKGNESQSNQEIKTIVEKYSFIQNNIKSTCRLYKVEPFFFLQPVPGYRNQFLKHPLIRRDPIPENLPVRMKYFSEFSQGGWMIDLSGLLSDYNKLAFVDGLHYAPEVNRMIADAIFSHIESSLARLVNQKNK